MGRKMNNSTIFLVRDVFKISFYLIFCEKVWHSDVILILLFLRGIEPIFLASRSYFPSTHGSQECCDYRCHVPYLNVSNLACFQLDLILYPRLDACIFGDRIVMMAWTLVLHENFQWFIHNLFFLEYNLHKKEEYIRVLSRFLLPLLPPDNTVTPQWLSSLFKQSILNI